MDDEVVGAVQQRGAITRDGCPVEVYRQLANRGEAEFIDAAIGPNSLVLDLGAGTGRIADALVGLGHDVVAVNTPDRQLRHSLLRSIAHNLDEAGTAFVEWHPPHWFDRLSPDRAYSGTLGAVFSTLTVLSMQDGRLEAEVSYDVGDDHWVQGFAAQQLTADELARDLRATGLQLAGDDPFHGDWVLITTCANLADPDTTAAGHSIFGSGMLY